MGLSAVLGELPVEFEVVEGRRGVVAVRRPLGPVLAAAGFEPDALAVGGPSDLSGRGPLGEIEHAGERFVVRPFRHGGLLRWLTGTRYADPARPFRELLCAERLAAAGVATPAVAAARAVRAPLFGWRLALVTRRVEEAVDLAEVLERWRRGRLPRAVRAGLARAAGELVGALHRLGLAHADLHPQNLLVARDALAGGEPRLWVLDLDRSRIGDAELPAPARRRNLARLARAVLRREGRGAPFLSRSDFRRFVAGYERGLGRGTPGAWKADWRDVRRRLARRSPWHRLGWWLEARLGAARG